MSGAIAPTERLYYTDAYQAEFTARVVDTKDDGRRVYLDATAFYPTSGGQKNDLGTLGGVSVVDIVDEENVIAHVLAGPVGDTQVTGKIDWRRRFDHMQQHTGQHLLSAVFDDLFGMKTVSVHFGDSHSTLDLESDSLSADKLQRAECRANEIIAENRAVSVGFEDAGTAKGLRKSVDREGALRIVSIDRLDRSACGGTHVRATGEIGCAMLRGTERIRNTMRVQFLCGLRAITRSRADFEALTGIAATLVRRDRRRSTTHRVADGTTQRVRSIAPQARARVGYVSSRRVVRRDFTRGFGPADRLAESCRVDDGSATGPWSGGHGTEQQRTCRDDGRGQRSARRDD